MCVCVCVCVCVLSYYIIRMMSHHIGVCWTILCRYVMSCHVKQSLFCRIAAKGLTQKESVCSKTPVLRFVDSKSSEKSLGSLAGSDLLAAAADHRRPRTGRTALILLLLLLLLLELLLIMCVYICMCIYIYIYIYIYMYI